MKKGIIVLTTSSLLIGSLGFVGAQNVQSTNETQTQSSQTQTSPMQRVRGFGGGFGDGDDLGRGFGGLPFGRPLALGTTVTLDFYATDPANGDSSMPEQTLTFIYGQDSEAAFAQSFAEARANAEYMTLNVGEQTQTLELPSTDTSSNDGYRNSGVYGALPLHALGEGASVTATFYDGDPSGDVQTLQTLNFTYGQDSEAGFATDFASAAENAAFVTLTTSPQTITVNLSEIASRFGDFGRGDFGRGDFGRGDSGRGGFMDDDFRRGEPGGRR